MGSATTRDHNSTGAPNAHAPAADLQAYHHGAPALTAAAKAAPSTMNNPWIRVMEKSPPSPFLR